MIRPASPAAPSLPSWFRPLIWLALAVLAGLIVAALPLTTAILLLGGAALVIAALAHPAALLAILLVLAPMRTLIATEFPRVTGGPWPLPLDVGQILAFALVASWLVHRILRGRAETRTIPWSPVYLPLIVFIVAGALTAFNAFSLGAWLTEWLKWLLMLVIAVVVYDLGREIGWRPFVFMLVMAALANALIGIYEFFGGSGALHLVVNERFFRAFGTFGQPNPFGGFMGLIAPLAITSALSHLLALWRRWRALRRVDAGALAGLVFYGAASAVIALALMLSWSRGAWLGFGVSLAVVAFALPRRLSLSLGLAAALLIGFGGLYASGRLPASVAERLGTIVEELFSLRDVRGVDITPENYAVIERLAHWQAAVEMATNQPWLGVGLGNYEAAYPAYRLLNWKFPLGHAHNYYLNVLGETGIIGLIAYGAFMVFVFAFAWRSRRHADPGARLAAIGVLGVWAYLAMHSLTDNLYVNNVFIHLSVTIGMLCILNADVMSRVRASRQVSNR
ncbi:MAG: O-antigen ligase family protein [Anaerolineae bacterium]|nr:O-antigen ligase family protein [Anaerolineae bacterium]